MTSVFPDDQFRNGCDESKCVSLVPISTISTSFTCYTDTDTGTDGNVVGGDYPMLCADGYQPRMVHDEPPLFLTDSNDDRPYKYYTCCPPLSSSTGTETTTDNTSSTITHDRRHCSDPVISNNTNTNIDDGSVEFVDTMKLCQDDDDDRRYYPHQMKNPRQEEPSSLSSYTCCDWVDNKYIIIEKTSTVNTVNTSSPFFAGSNSNSSSLLDSFLDDIECVQYRNDLYEKAIIQNTYGHIFVRKCNFDVGSSMDSFTSPRIDTGNPSKYECCKNTLVTAAAAATVTVEPFLVDTAFRMTVYPQIIVSSMAVICCLIIILGLLIPFIVGIENTKNTSRWKKKTDCTGASTVIRSTTAARRASTGGASNKNSRTAVIYNPYNMYLCSLAVPDLILNTYLLGMYISFANQKYNPRYSKGNIVWNEIAPPAAFASFEGAFVVACSTANLYMNVIISFEMFILLKSNHDIQRYAPPKLRKVVFQSISVYVFAIIIFVTHYFICRAVSEGKILFLKTNTVWSLIVTYILPIGFFAGVCFLIWYRSYIKATNRKLRQCVLYFFRIIVVFCIIWLPGMLLLVIGAPTRNGTLISLGLLFCAIQPIVSTCMAMTKHDVRNYCLDFITLSYCFKNNKQQQQQSNEEEKKIENPVTTCKAPIVDEQQYATSTTPTSPPPSPDSDPNVNINDRNGKVNAEEEILCDKV
ncbi:hypothetical protein FRACYDRAFT_254554 [Fragilariopsis cylindrus CCMP1102]|uniref:G-protein coupled receptors family 1 profile domain-containing protein n=1 Tax=Fragilariopsis cylindrus CCMP1102 TaxID=635003 RepID=A0A1E7ELU1_9STRA|nr:hypothetical protein FRACYDRAFT_254554 [Fragilariopsis cylindrus CCMP1102]|eukprot:OEU06533.1 hypothetical protein FRACYDRAFT_254554 [Fragilariopsis cylindrus CCMP1102]